MSGENGRESYCALGSDGGKLLGDGGTKTRLEEGDGWQMMTRQKMSHLVGYSHKCLKGFSGKCEIQETKRHYLT